MSVAETEPTTPLKAAALAYARRGWHVIPLHHNVPGGCSCNDPACDSHGKHPRTRNGLNSASNDPDDIDYFWDQWPNANIGIVSGPSKLAVVDLDNPEAITRWKQLHPDLPPTYTVKTGNGYHLYFHDATGLEPPSNTTPDPADQGIDYRAGPSYVVAPPSVHYNGTSYTVARDIDPIPLPLAVQAYFATRRKKRPDTIEDAAIISKGGRDNYLASVAGSMRSLGMTQSEMEAALLRINQDRLDPPLDEREVRRVARSIARYELGSPELLQVVTFGTITEGEPDAPGISWKPINLNDRETNPPPPPSIGGCIYAGKRHALSGEPEAGKSWLALRWCYEVIHAGDHAAYIDHEMGPDMTKERLRALGASKEDVDRFLYIDPVDQIEHGIAWVEQMLDQHQPRIIVVDATIGNLSLHGYDPNVGKDIEAWYQRVVNRLARKGAAIVLLDHVTKKADDRGMYAIGSERKTGAADVHLFVEKQLAFGRDRIGKSKVLVKKDRPGHLPRPTLATFTLDTTLPGVEAWTWQLATDAPEHSADDGHFRPTVLMQRVSDYLEQHSPASKNMIETGVLGRANGIRLAIEALHIEGFIAIGEAVGKKGGGVEITLLKPYYESSGDHESQPRPTSSNLVRDEVTEPRPPYGVGDERSRDEVTNSTSSNGTRLEAPCPSCSTTLAASPHLTAGGTYCCHDCARGEACACKYLHEELA